MAVGPGIFLIHQIFYDSQTRAQLDPGFIPLDNTRNERPDWYEFWPIRSFLKRHTLDEDAWYGFVSPKFFQKTGLRSAALVSMLERVQAGAEVVLVPYSWDQLAYFENPFEQGDYWHPGLLGASQKFLDSCRYPVDLSRLVSHSGSAAFSNFLIARPGYWRAWLELADLFVDYVEGDQQRGGPISSLTTYGTDAAQVPMKTFVQERFPALLLAAGRFRTARVDVRPILYEPLFFNDAQTYRALFVCDFLKERYCDSNDTAALSMYRKVRNDIRTRVPVRLLHP